AGIGAHCAADAGGRGRVGCRICRSCRGSRNAGAHSFRESQAPMMSITEQIIRMRQLYPAFEVVFNGGWHVIWKGALRPLSQTYVVRVEIVESRTIGDLRVIGTLGANVTLVSPEL